jgi:serine/threonine protein kinase
MALEAGRILHDRYRLIRPIGHGSQASVWIAEHLALTTTVAVKLIDPELAKKESARERFRREATAAAQLRSAHVVQILDHGIEGDQPFIVMELLDGEDLFERLTHRTRISLRETSKVVTQVARALTRAHAAGIVHRDLKPENIFLVPNDDDEVVKVLDFGVAKFKDPGKAAMQRTGLGTLIGTPHYMSPEQVKGISEIDYRADLWALGVIAFQCVTGELPFDSEGVGDLLIKISIGDIPVPSKVFPSIPANFDAWFLRACDRDPAKRFQSAREMAVALGGVVGVFGEGGIKQPTIRPPGKISIFPAAAEPPATLPAAPKPSAPNKPPAPRPAPYAPAWANKPAPIPREEPVEESVDDDDWDEAPTRMKPSRDSIDSTEIDFDEPEVGDRMSHAGFPLITRAQPPPSSASAPPPPAPSRPAAPPARRQTPPSSVDAAPPQRESRPTPAPRPMPPRQPLPPGNPFTDTSTPAPPPRHEEQRSSDTSGVPSSGGLRPSTVSGLARSGLTPTDPPPELDGSRRRRMVRILAVALVLGAAGVAWGVVRSQLHTTPAADPAEIPSAPPPPSASTPPAPSMVIPSFTAAAVDPGKVSRPTRPTPTVKPNVGTPRPRVKRPPDGVIEVPDGPPDDAVPPAP